MMYNPRVLSVNSKDETAQQLKEMGIDPSCVDAISSQMFHLSLVLENVEDAVADILKKEMDSIMGSVVFVYRTSYANAQSTDLILSGSHKQFKDLVQRIKGQAFELNGLGDTIEETIDNQCKDGFIIRCKKADLDLRKRTHIMGIVNVTPDSFSDGGMFFNTNQAVTHALKLVDEGADIIDIGGESSRPGSQPINVQEETERVVPVIERLAREISVPISIDTYRSSVAEKAIQAGAEIINDISAFCFDPEMPGVAARYDVPVVLMHMKGTPEKMQQSPLYESLMSEIIDYLRKSIETAHKAGVNPNKIIIDPGIGFGKSVEEGHNLKIIKRLKELRTLGKPMLVGLSRKAFIGEILNADVTEREEGSAAAVSAAILNGAHIIRVHNVDMSRKVVQVIDSINKEIGTRQ